MSPLPDTKQGRVNLSPLHARVMVAGTPKVGKSTMAAAWSPDTTLIVDTHNGTRLLDGEHFIAHGQDCQTVAGELFRKYGVRDLGQFYGFAGNRRYDVKGG